MSLSKPNPDYGDCMTVVEFLECVQCGGFIDYDGWGYLSDGTNYDPDVTIRPSGAPGCIPKGTTHILWMNR